jgi:SAM-dependent methyltransferase
MTTSMPTEPAAAGFESLIDEARTAALSGWDFSFLAGRTTSEVLPWSYLDLAVTASRTATRVLDIDTGGGEVLALIKPPPGSVAVEPHPPNVPVATAALAPLGVQVRARMTPELPVSDAAFDLVLNRHGLLDAAEISRVLQPGGGFLTQQVGSRNDLELNEAFGLEPVKFDSALDKSRAGARAAGGCWPHDHACRGGIPAYPISRRWRHRPATARGPLAGPWLRRRPSSATAAGDSQPDHSARRFHRHQSQAVVRGDAQLKPAAA